MQPHAAEANATPTRTEETPGTPVRLDGLNKSNGRNVSGKAIVNSWNEWDPLLHVIVGRADNGQIPAPEPALNAKVPEDSDLRDQWGRRPQETIDRANGLLDRFSAQLRARGIRVDRP